MAKMNTKITYTAFTGSTLIASDSLLNLQKLKDLPKTTENILIFNDQTGQQIDLDLSGSEQEFHQRYGEPEEIKKLDDLNSE